MELERRSFLKKSGMAALAGMLPWSLSCSTGTQEKTNSQTDTPPPKPADKSWRQVRSDFELNPDYIHMAALLLSAHPRPVREAMEQYREQLNANPAMVEKHYSAYQERLREAAADYMKVQPNDIGLTGSTTMGTALIINGLKIRSDQEMLTADMDYYSTRESIKYKAKRSGASYREVPIYDSIHQVSEDEIVDKLTSQIRPETRLVTGTWVHSSTGLKIPVRKIADRINEINLQRDPEDWALFFLDGVHGFGVENSRVGDLGCDFFSAGTHKWMLGPRGTGVIWGHPRMQQHVSPTIPTFTNYGGWGGDMTPGGFKSFDHHWAMDKAFEYHQDLGPEKVEQRIHSLARQLKEGLAKMDHVRLYTPMDDSLSAGIICFDVDGMRPPSVVANLENKNIIASTTPYEVSYPRLSPAIYNTETEIEEVLRAVRELQ